jgi:hypothetical protein
MPAKKNTPKLAISKGLSERGCKMKSGQVLIGRNAFFLVFLLCYLFTIPVYAEDEDVQVIQKFSQQEKKQSNAIQIEQREKHLIMFIMGVPLLLFILTTVALGIAMGFYGKQVFVAHMIFAGLSLTLALAHAIVGIVWFFPF